MLNRQVGLHADEIMRNRRQFCLEQGVDFDDVVYQWINYHDDATYHLITEVDARNTTKFEPAVIGDTIITRSRNVGIFLPLADCVGIVLHDPATSTLTVMHMGRHSTLTDVIPRLFTRLRTDGVEVANLIAWMSPAVQRQSYRLVYFDHADTPEWRGFIDHRDDGVYIDMVGYNTAQLIAQGIEPVNIHASSVDSARDPHYFSHSQGDHTGRFAILAYMK